MNDIEEMTVELVVVTDELNIEIQKVEEVFQGLSLGVRASIPLNASTSLVFKRGEKGWHFFVQTGPSCIQLRQAPRSVRAHAVDLFPALLQELANQTEVLLEQVRVARDKARAFLVALNTATEATSKK